MKLWDAKEAITPLDSTGFGVYGPIQLAPNQLDCIDKIGEFVNLELHSAVLGVVLYTVLLSHPPANLAQDHVLLINFVNF